MGNDARVVITGVGPLSAIGIGKTKVWESINKARTGLVVHDYCCADTISERFPVHKIEDFTIDQFGIDKRVLDDITAWKSQTQWDDLGYLLAGVKIALDDSKLTFDPEDTRNRIGLVLAHENPGLDEFYAGVIDQSYNLLRENPSAAKKEYFFNFFNTFRKQAYDLQTFMFLFHAAKAFGMHGYSLFLNNACASGLYALEAASDIIKSGKCDAVVVSAADQASLFKYLWFKELGMYSSDGRIKPFAANSDGFVLGDGGAGIVLESLDSAQKRGTRIYAEYLGGSFSLEGWKVSVPDVTSNSYQEVITQAMQTSGISTDDIDLLLPHGVGTSVTDYYEAKAIADVFGSKSRQPLVTAFKPYVGHTLGSTALLETAILLLALEHNYIPKTLNTEEIDPRFTINLVKQSTKKDLTTVMKTACGFAGYNAACVFQKIR